MFRRKLDVAVYHGLLALRRYDQVQYSTMARIIRVTCGEWDNGVKMDRCATNMQECAEQSRCGNASSPHTARLVTDRLMWTPNERKAQKE